MTAFYTVGLLLLFLSFIFFCLAKSPGGRAPREEGLDGVAFGLLFATFALGVTEALS